MTPGAWRAAGELWAWRGHDIFYREEGEGPALVCIHGFPTSSWDWQKLWPSLIQRFRVLAPDLLGFGFSDKPREHDYSLFEQADLIEAFLAAREADDVHILAHDYGDTVAQELLMRHRERVERGEGRLGIRSCCFLNGGLFMDQARPRRMQELLKGRFGPIVARMMTRSRFARGFSEVFGPHSQPTEEELDGFWEIINYNRGSLAIPRVIQYMDERMANLERWTGALQRTPVTLRLIVGLLDPVSGATIADHYERVVPNPDVVRLDNCGHYPQVEDPEAVLAALLAFIDGVAGTAAP